MPKHIDDAKEVCQNRSIWIATDCNFIISVTKNEFTYLVQLIKT